MLAPFILLVILLSGQSRASGQDITYTQALEQIEKRNIKSVCFCNGKEIYLLTDAAHEIDFPSGYYNYRTEGDPEAFLRDAERLTASGGKKNADELSTLDLPFSVMYRTETVSDFWTIWLPSLLPVLLLIFFWLMMNRQQNMNANKAMSFGKSKATLIDPAKNKVTFADVAGAKEEKEELAEIVDFLKNPKAYLDLGARIPKGVLMVGPPGTGKTLLAKAVAGEARVPFFSISGSDFVEMFVGMGASRVRDLFDQAKRNAPSIVFIDEIDAVGRHRGAGLGGGHDEREQTLNQLLVEMDGFTDNEGVIVLAATNRRDILDPALLRPGRFDRQITVNYPDYEGRIEILKVHSKGKPLDDDFDIENLAKRTPYATGADLANIMNESALQAAREKKTTISWQNVVDAVERVQMGPAKKSHKVLEEDRRITAYHEAGHAIVANYLNKCDEVHLITVIPRGQAAGFTLALPPKEYDHVGKEELLDQVSMVLGGRAAESITQDDICTGAVSDLQRATEIARSMVTKYGMSDELGLVYLANDQEVFVGMEFGQSREYSEQTAARIDSEVRRIIQECYAKALDILKAHRDALECVAKALIEKETLNREEFLSAVEQAEKRTTQNTVTEEHA